jgi:undecaprenyl phosphate N,N'-diacetylbacillosamine 1-phosphate transferase
MRRLIDIVFAIFWLIITTPVFLLIAILIRVDSSVPVFYSPQMVGHNGKKFALFRFRTMSPEAHQRGNEQRLTRIGRMLRNYSLDHLPQLINLLKGDLTIIGPRPMELNVVNLQEPIWRQYFQVKPGLFNYAVVKLGKFWTPSRSTHPNLNQELELEFQQKRSVTTDLKLFAQFVRKFFVSRGNIKARGEPDLKE